MDDYTWVHNVAAVDLEELSRLYRIASPRPRRLSDALPAPPAGTGKTERRLSLPDTLVNATQITQIRAPRSASRTAGTCATRPI